MRRPFLEKSVFLNIALSKPRPRWLSSHFPGLFVTAFFPLAVQTADHKPSTDRDPLMLPHFQGILSTEQTEPKLFDLAFETGHNEVFPAYDLRLVYASAELVSTLELQGTINSTSPGVLFISTLQNVSCSLRPSSMYFSSRKHSLVQAKRISFPFFELS